MVKDLSCTARDQTSKTAIVPRSKTGLKGFETHLGWKFVEAVNRRCCSPRQLIPCHGFNERFDPRGVVAKCRAYIDAGLDTLNLCKYPSHAAWTKK